MMKRSRGEWKPVEPEKTGRVEVYKGMSFDLCVEEAQKGGFTVEAIIWHDTGEWLTLEAVVGGTNLVLETRSLAESVARSLAKQWIEENA